MVRKALYVAIPYTIGVLTAYFLHGTNYVYLAIAISLVVTCVLKSVIKMDLKPSVLCETSFIVGFLILSNYMVTHVDCLSVYEDQLVEFTGRVVEVKDYTDMSSYVLDGTIGQRQKVRLSLYTSTLECSYGDNVVLTGTLESIDGNYLFDSEQYYRSNGIYLEVGELSSIEVIPNSNVGIDLVRTLQAYRDSVINTFKLNMSKDGSSLMSAILFGDKSDLSKEDKSSLTRSGLGSLIAVSGFHLAVLTSLLTAVLNFLDRRDLSIPRVLKVILYEGFMLFFITLVGFPISAVRTFIMLSISNMATVFFRKPDTLNTLCVSILIMLTCEPYLVGNVSFLLSVAGVYGIGVLAPYFLKPLEVPKVLKGVLTIAITTVCTVPICACFFDEVSILSPVTNIVCVPLCEISIVCGFFVFILGGKTFFLTKALLFVADISCRCMLSICGVFSKLSFGNFPTGYNVLIYVMVLCVVMCITSYGVFRNVKRLAVTMVGSVMIVFVSLGIVTHVENNVLKVTMMGNSKYQVMVMSYHNDVNVVDFSKNYKTSSYVEKYLKQYGYSKVSSITFLKKAYQSMVMYGVQLNDYSVGTINVPQGTNLRSDYTLLGTYPTQTDFSNHKLVYYYGTYVVTVYEDGTVEILTSNGISQTFNIEELNTTLEYYNSGQFKVKELK